MNETTDTTSLRALLSRVAAGDLDPGEAARLLDADPAAPTLDQRDDVRAEPPVSALALHAGGVKLTVVADPTVDTAVADGPHALRREGSVLVLDAPSEDGFRTTPPPRFLGWVPTVWTGGRGQKVLVRVNPSLPLTVEATACSVDVSGLRAPLTLGGSASSVKVRDHVGALHGSLAMGSLVVVATVDAPSDLVCELGSLDLRLLPGSDVTVTATSDLGEVKLPGVQGAEKSSARQTYVAGAGTHPFTLAVRLGSASVAGA
ncbi:MAG: hypothetical protein AB7I24_08040 [Candidatus Nanopelagicales bacterium]